MVETDHQTKEPSESTSDPDWEARVLCSDESCIGVIGADGRCRVCGQPAGAAAQATPHPGDGEPDKPLAEPARAPETEPQPADDDTGADPDWEARVLCSDESCIGVIGADGRCRVCGQPHVPPGH